MLKIDVMNFRGIERGQVECDPIALLSAPNDRGKSSVSIPAACALVGEPLPKPWGLTKGQAKQLVRDGQESAVVRVQSGAGFVRMSWPQCTHDGEGEIPIATPIAVGLTSLVHMDARERSKALEGYLDAEPTEADFSDEMNKAAAAINAQFSPETIKKVWGEIDVKGWDRTASDYETLRRDAGRDWLKITRAAGTFGEDKAARWRPEGWEDELDDTTVETLQGRVAEAIQKHEAAVASAAVGAAEIDRLRKLAGEVDKRRELVTNAESGTQSAIDAEAEARKERAELPSPALTGASMDCPHCGKPVMFQQGDLASGPSLVKYTKPKAGPAGLEEKIADADSKIRMAEIARKAAEGLIEPAKAALAEAEAAARSLAAAEADEKTGTEEAVAAARAYLAACKRNLENKGQIIEARGYLRDWRRSNLILGILAPAGLRARKLGEAIGKFNEGLASLSTLAGWREPVNVTEGLLVQFGARPLPLACAGEQWRSLVTLQVQMASLDKSALIVLDDLPDIDKPAMNGLFRMVRDKGLHALLCKAPGPDAPADWQPPDLHKAGMGHTYTVEDHRTKLLYEEPAAEAA